MPGPRMGPCFHEATVDTLQRPIVPASLPSNAPPFKVVVTIEVDPDGSIRKATIYKSSGYSAVDAAVIKAAHTTLYRPKVVDCKPVTGIYLLQYRFPEDFLKVVFRTYFPRAVVNQVVAPATASPSPTPTGNSTGAAATTLSFADALSRLIPHATDHFAEDRGVQGVMSDNALRDYPLKFGISGLTDCRIVDSDVLAFAACTAYRGNDEATARSAYYALKGNLHTFAGREVPINETVNTRGGAKFTTATYRPNVNVLVTIEMIEMAEGMGNSFVVFSIKTIPSL